jgi:lipopolysaccharide transport system ATP-binding protein
MRLYSSGMVARVAFAICANADADILIVDEALSVGDEVFQAKCEAFIADFAKTGTILVVSHDLDFLSGLCDRIIWIDGGAVRAVGAPNDIIPFYKETLLAAA